MAKRLKSKCGKMCNVFIFVFSLVCLGLLMYSLINIINWKSSVDENEKRKEELKEHIDIIGAVESSKVKYNIDFESLQDVNPDAIAYIKVNGTNIDYIVVKGYDNDYYLSHNFNKKYNKVGWIFADYHNMFDNNDKNIVIYGHNTKDGSMFGTLIKVLEREWQENEENLIVTLVTEKGQYEYQVFSTYSITPEDYYINTIFNSDAEFDEFINTIKSRSNYDYNVEVNLNDKILTLSSCIGTGKKRVVLHAKLI